MGLEGLKDDSVRGQFFKILPILLVKILGDLFTLLSRQVEVVLVANGVEKESHEARTIMGK